MKNSKIQLLSDYWENLRSGRIAPYRSEVDPREIAPLLDSTFILEHLGGNNVRFRLAGTKLCESFGMELRGMSALALWQGECREKVRRMIDRVINEPCIGRVSCTVETRDAHLFNAEFIYMPLRSDFGEVSRILGCGYYSGAHGQPFGAQAPVRHWVDSISYKTIQVEVIEAPVGLQHPDHPYRQPRISAGRQQTFGRRTHFLRAIEGGAEKVRAASEAPRDTGHLRLIKSDAG